MRKTSHKIQIEGHSIKHLTSTLQNYQENEKTRKNLETVKGWRELSKYND